MRDSLVLARLSSTVMLVIAFGCGPSIEEPEPIPEHRIEPCETWCGMMLDPVCPAAEVEVETEMECVEVCGRNDALWGRNEEGEDVCTATYLPYLDCLTALSCDELHHHFALLNGWPQELPSQCGGLLQEQLDCQLPYQ